MIHHDDEKFPGGAVGFYLFLLFALTFAFIVTAVQWAGRLVGRR